LDFFLNQQYNKRPSIQLTEARNILEEGRRRRMGEDGNASCSHPDLVGRSELIGLGLEEAEGKGDRRCSLPSCLLFAVS